MGFTDFPFLVELSLQENTLEGTSSSGNRLSNTVQIIKLRTKYSYTNYYFIYLIEQDSMY